MCKEGVTYSETSDDGLLFSCGIDGEYKRLNGFFNFVEFSGHFVPILLTLKECVLLDDFFYVIKRKKG